MSLDPLGWKKYWPISRRIQVRKTDKFNKVLFFPADIIECMFLLKLANDSLITLAIYNFLDAVFWFDFFRKINSH